MITYEEAIKQNIKLVGQGKKPDFTISTITNINTDNNISNLTEIRKILNSKLKIKNYVNEKIAHLIITLIVLPKNWEGVEYIEQKYYRKKHKNLFVDLKVPNYEKFSKANNQEILEIMAEQILRAAKKYLSKVKGFDFERFYYDLESLFKKEGIL